PEGDRQRFPHAAIDFSDWIRGRRRAHAMGNQGPGCRIILGRRPMRSLSTHLAEQIEALRRDGLYKAERLMLSPQRSSVTVLADGEAPVRREVVNFCANNYLGLSDDPRIVAAAKAALDR